MFHCVQGAQDVWKMWTKQIRSKCNKGSNITFFCFSKDFFGADENVKAEKDEVTITIAFQK